MILIFNNFKKKFKNPKFISRSNCLYNNKSKLLENIWADKILLKKSYNYLNKLNKNIIKQLAKKYKNNFGLNFSLKFWEILLYPWVSYFTFIIFDNYKVLQKICKDKNISEILVSKNILNDYTPYDYQQFAHLLKNDEYRFFIFSNIAKFFIKKNIKKKYINLNLKKSKNIYLNGNYRNLKIQTKILFFFLRIIFNFKKKNIILDLPINNVYKKFKYLVFLLKFAFIPFKYNNYGKTKEHDKILRSKFILNLNHNNFEKILSQIIPHQIPKSIFENLNENLDFVRKNYPKKIDKISSAHSFWGDDLVKIWIAMNVEKKTHFFPRQHGGSYGTDKLHTNEYIEKKLGNSFLSWGWKGRNVKPMPSIEKNILFEKNAALFKNYKNKKIIEKGFLLILSPSNRYSKNIYSTPMSDEWYLHNQKIISFLTKYLKNFERINVRARPYFDSWDFYNHLKNISPKIKVGFGEQKIEKEMNKYSLIIGTNPSTTMYDILISKKPCIFIWPKNLWTYRSSAQKYFQLLVKEKILFYNEDEAVKHLNKISNNIPSWWNDKNRQKTLKIFLDNFCLITSDYLSIWEKFITKNKYK
jgi:putative transferase (TIGR04331 family)